VAYEHTLLLSLRAAAQPLEFLLYRVLEGISLKVQTYCGFGWLRRTYQLVIEFFDVIADCRTGKGQHPGMLKSRKRCGSRQQRLTGA
jgi:hypothetical protein